MESFLQELHRCPTLTATTLQGYIVMAKMSNDAQKLMLLAVNQDNKTFKSEFNAATLANAVTATGGAWDKFFQELQTAFNTGKVACTTGALVQIGLQAKSIDLPLENSTEDGLKKVFDALVNYQHLHTHHKEAERQLEDLTKREQEARTQAAELEKEEQSLRDTINRSKDQEAQNQKKLQQLRGELQAAGGSMAENEFEEELALCRVRNPLGKKSCKDIDPNLLRLLKSKWVTADKEIPDTVRCHKVVRPFTTSELTAHTKSFTDQQRGVIWECLTKIDQWDFDVFAIQTQMSGDDHHTLPFQDKGGVLFVVMYSLLFKYGLMQKFNLDEQILVNWLSCVEAGYHGNPYHNSVHAADVLHITHFILSQGGLSANCKLSDEDTFAALFAACIHDYDHPGINNNFHIKAGTYLATLYNDKSILENKHVSTVFELMKLPKFNILQFFTEDQRRDIRETIIEMVLATDMGLHAKFMQQFKRRLVENKEFTKKDDIRLGLSMALKMADISNCGRPTPLYLRWSSKISDEFYIQGDRERNLGLPCSPFMDRNNPAMAKGQIAFMNYIVVPLFESVAELLPNMKFVVGHTDSNKAYWVEHDDS